MELIIGILVVALIIGLFVRDKGDNTMDTLSKGCGLLMGLAVIILIILFVFGVIAL
jgi:hypothetical protein